MVSLFAAQRKLLHFELGGRSCALPLESIQEILPMAWLSRPPGMPSILQGFLNLRGAAVPVLRLDRLLRLPKQSLGLFTPLIVLKPSGAPIADAIPKGARDGLPNTAAPIADAIPKGARDGLPNTAAPIALLIEAAASILSVPEEAFQPVGEERTFNGCAEALAQTDGCSIHLLSPSRLLLEAERRRIEEFRVMEQERLQGLTEERP